MVVKISKINFLWGNNDRGWKTDFNWVLNENNLLKILEGKYKSDDSPESKNIFTMSDEEKKIEADKIYSKIGIKKENKDG